MKPIAIWWHTCLNLFPDHAESIARDQINTLRTTGLMDACNQFYVGLNGSEGEREKLQGLAGPKPIIFCNTPETWQSGEVQTLRELREWLPVFSDYNVLYFHMKGLTAPPGAGHNGMSLGWRRDMESVVLHRWRECVQHLDEGYDSVGRNWITPFDQAYWAGNFWWATAKFLATIPPLRHSDVEHGRMEAEVWIGQGPKWPRVKDLK